MTYEVYCLQGMEPICDQRDAVEGARRGTDIGNGDGKERRQLLWLVLPQLVPCEVG